MKKIMLLMSFIAISAHAETVSIKLEKACAYPDDRVNGQVDFMVSTHSIDLLQKDSPIMSITPGYCKNDEARANYNMNVSFDSSLSKPLEIQIGERFFLKAFKLSFRKIVIGSTAQLAQADCTDSDLTCINVDDLKQEAKSVEIVTKTGLFQRRKIGLFKVNVSI